MSGGRDLTVHDALALGNALWKYLTEADPEDPESEPPALAIEDHGIEIANAVWVPIPFSLAENLREVFFWEDDQ